MRPFFFLSAVAAALVLSACGGASEPAPDASSAPATAPAEMSSEPAQAAETAEASAGPADPEAAASLLCMDLRLADSYRDAGTPGDEAEAMALELGAATDALDEGSAHPELHAIAMEHMGDPEATAAALKDWCKEHTEPVNPSSPW
ncbi:hypothetical protein [Streptomonospora litoralis]|uniref:Uncharacterized protein n=1 Tax=Streptomonospora litoralis TaxID=2498135 RepID=A0A4P6QB93_9ACTN|nr:hypothetical protein [Streptomonospora litoralis]QBI56844.1 hypothetical protein EKD16_25520 [Streptomonospora litoralis]